jgi:hypothetical protein
MAPPCITEGEHAATVRKRIQPPMPVMRAQALQAAITMRTASVVRTLTSFELITTRRSALC